MKAYVKSYEEIEKSGIRDNSYIYAKGVKVGENTFVFVPKMIQYCKKGPFEFKRKTCENGNKWYIGLNWMWHKSWLNFVKNGQYLLEFE